MPSSTVRVRADSPSTISKAPHSTRNTKQDRESIARPRSPGEAVQRKKLKTSSSDPTPKKSSSSTGETRAKEKAKERGRTNSSRSLPDPPSPLRPTTNPTSSHAQPPTAQSSKASKSAPTNAVFAPASMKKNVGLRVDQPGTTTSAPTETRATDYQPKPRPKPQVPIPGWKSTAPKIRVEESDDESQDESVDREGGAVAIAAVKEVIPQLLNGTSSRGNVEVAGTADETNEASSSRTARTVAETTSLRNPDSPKLISGSTSTTTSTTDGTSTSSSTFASGSSSSTSVSPSSHHSLASSKPQAAPPKNPLVGLSISEAVEMMSCGVLQLPKLREWNTFVDENGNVTESEAIACGSQIKTMLQVEAMSERVKASFARSGVKLVEVEMEVEMVKLVVRKDKGKGKEVDLD